MYILKQRRTTNPNLGSVHSIIDNWLVGGCVDAGSGFGKPIVEDFGETLFVGGFAPVDTFGFGFFGGESFR